MACWFAASLIACGRTTRQFGDGARGYDAGKVGGDGEGQGGTDDGLAGGDAGAAGSTGESGAAGEGGEGGAGGTMEPVPEPEPPPEPVSDCSKRAETYHDPNTGQTWSTVFYCWNKYDAHLYQKPNAGTPHVGFMETTHSWFVCYRHGQQHAGLNDVWYYTQGDRATSGWSGRAAWGYMAAVDVETSTNPVPGIPECAVE